MNYNKKYPNTKYMDMADNSHLVGNECGCIMCGEPTKFIEVCSEAHFCSEECEKEFYKQMNESIYEMEKE